MRNDNLPSMHALELMFVCFAAVKLTGLTDISWFVVTMPLWGGALVLAGAALLMHVQTRNSPTFYLTLEPLKPMPDFSELKTAAAQAVKQRPELEEEILDIVQLAKDNIEEGESPSNEVELALGSIKELLEQE